MNVEELREYCLSLPFAKENMPIAKHEYSDLVTFTVADKWFCLLDLPNKRINVKCDPDVCLDMRDRYQGAFPAWHMNKKHWLGVMLDSDMPNSVIEGLIHDGYKLIFNKLQKQIKVALNGGQFLVSTDRGGLWNIFVNTSK